jgi:plasmid stability protein
VAYTLHLELSLRNAAERIRSLEAEVRRLRAESLVTEGCMLSQALLDPTQMGFYRD